MDSKKTQIFILFSSSVVFIALIFITMSTPSFNNPVPISESPAADQSSTDSKPLNTDNTAPKLNLDNDDSAEKITHSSVERVSVDAQTPSFKTKDGQIFPLRTYRILANDPYANQWWTTSTGLDIAWQVGSGPNQTTVAVIDTGFALNHEEFTNRWATNNDEIGSTTSESPSKLNCTDQNIPLDKSCNLIDDDFDEIVDNGESGPTTKEASSQLNCTDQSLPLNKSCNMIDDDNNGYADDVLGWDFANFGPSPLAGKTNPDGESTSHGTNVIGMLAATGNNSIGIAGVDWNTKILPLQSINDDGYGNTLTVARSIYYATDRGVDVISLSLGTDQSDDYIREAITYAIDNGVIVVAASGNDGCNCISYPANYPEVVAVGSHTSLNMPSTFNSYGNNLDILAPGENIRSSTWTKLNQISAYETGLNGTSFATPYVSGLLSLARSHQPDASWGELVNGLLAQASHVGLTYSTPFSAQIGSGYVKADKLITRVTNPVNSSMRYGFGPTKLTSTLASGRIYQCFDPEDFPTAPFYRIAKGLSIFYTIDSLEAYKAIGRGDVVTSLGRTCVGLPYDTSSVFRSINLLSEIDNIQPGKQ